MRRMILSIVVVLLTMLTLLAIEPPGVEKQVTSGEYVVRTGETLHGGLFISSPGVVTIERGARVDGAIFMGSGELNVDGEVGGGIFSLSGDVNLDPDAVVQGHVTVTSVPFDAPAGARIENDLAADVSGWMGGPIGAALLLLVLTASLFAWPAIRNRFATHGEAGPQASGREMMRTYVLLAAAIVVLTVAVLIGAWLAGMEQVTSFWTLAILIPAVALIGLSIARHRMSPSLAVPAAVLGVTGVTMAIQTVTGHWQSWAYVWALVLPASVGLGRLTAGWRAHDAHITQSGRRLIGLGLTLVVASVAIIAAAASGVAAWWLIVVILIGIGSYWLVGQIRHPHRPVTGT